MVPYRGVSNRFLSNYQASLNYADTQQNPNNFDLSKIINPHDKTPVASKVEHSMHKAILFEAQHQVTTRKMVHSFNYSGGKWSPEEEEMIMMAAGIDDNNREEFFMKQQCDSENRRKLHKPLILHFSEVKTPPMVLTLFDELKDLNSIRFKEA